MRTVGDLATRNWQLTKGNKWKAHLGAQLTRFVAFKNDKGQLLHSRMNPFSNAKLTKQNKSSRFGQTAVDIVIWGARFFDNRLRKNMLASARAPPSFPPRLLPFYEDAGVEVKPVKKKGDTFRG